MISAVVQVIIHASPYHLKMTRWPKKPGWKDDAGKFYIKVKQSLPKIQK